MSAQVSAGAAGGQEKAELSADLPARILVEATRLFAEHGWGGTSVRGVAEAAGCSAPALYYHFAGKEALWVAAVGACYRRLGELQMGSRVPGATVREQLTASLTAMVDLATAEPHVLWLLYRAARHPEEGQPQFPPAEQHQRAREGTAALLRQGMERGELRPDLEPDVVAGLIHGAVDYRLGELFYEGRPIEERWAERAVEQLFRGLEA